MKQTFRDAAYKVYTTTDYSIFKTMKGNRPVSPQRKDNIIKSIEMIGWIRQPILVNEDMEIVDGQGRFEALQKLNMPVEFIIDEGLRIDECRNINIHQSNWQIIDYIHSYAALGNKNYIFLEKLMETYKGISVNAIQRAVSEQRYKPTSGNFICSAEDYRTACNALDYLKSVEPFIVNINGRVELLEVAIVFIYKHEDCDLQRLYKVLEKAAGRRNMSVSGLNDSFRLLEELYNYKCRSNLMNFANDYKEYARINMKRSRSIRVDKNTNTNRSNK